MDELMQMAVIELIRMDAKRDSEHMSDYIQILAELLTTSSHAVKYEAAVTLAGLADNVLAV